MTNNGSKDKIVLFLGAGASQFAGYYTFVNFPELIFNREIRNQEGMPALSPNSERLLTAIRGSLDRNNKATTHDNFLWRLDGYNQFLRLNQIDDALQAFVTDNAHLFDLNNCTQQAISQISATTIHHYSINRVLKAKELDNERFNNMKKVFLLYRKLAEINSEMINLPIFTTNYDLLMEDLVQEFNSNEYPMHIINGMPSVTRELEVWDENVYVRNEPTSFYLHRLHGCVCWFYHNQFDAAVHFHRRDATHQEITRLCAMYPGRETEIGIGPYGHSFRTMYRSLQECKLVIFIGFSFRDDDVMHILLKALSEREGNLKILVIDQLYTRDDIIIKLREASRRTTFPFRIPQIGEIDSVQINFGTDRNFDNTILNKVNQLLQ